MTTVHAFALLMLFPITLFCMPACKVRTCSEGETALSCVLGTLCAGVNLASLFLY